MNLNWGINHLSRATSLTRLLHVRSISIEKLCKDGCGSNLCLFQTHAEAHPYFIERSIDQLTNMQTFYLQIFDMKLINEVIEYLATSFSCKHTSSTVLFHVSKRLYNRIPSLLSFLYRLLR